MMKPPAPGVETEVKDPPNFVIDAADLDVDAGTLTLHWRDDRTDRSAMLFLGHVLKRSGSPRGRVLLALARDAGGLDDDVSDEDLVDDFI